MEKKRRKPGPKPKGPFEDKRRTLTTRITDETRLMLEAAAAQTGRSLSQEIEFRLETSLKLAEMSGGVEYEALFQMMAGAARMIEARLGRSPFTDGQAGMAVLVAWRKIMSAALNNRDNEELNHLLAERNGSAEPDLPAPRPGDRGKFGPGILGEWSPEELQAYFEQRREYEAKYEALKQRTRELWESHQKALMIGLETGKEALTLLPPPRARGK
jgi:uncharacterized protein (DUF1778 family)